MPIFTHDPVALREPTETDATSARDASRQLAAYLGTSHRLMLQIVADDIPQECVVVPQEALRLFVHLLAEMAQGHAVTLTSIPAELTTQQAADLLQVSRPHVVRLLEDGQMPFRKVGTHRRILLRDVLAYQHRTMATRAHALDALVAQAQELRMGY